MLDLARSFAGVEEEGKVELLIPSQAARERVLEASDSKMIKLYGLQGRITSGIAALAGALTAVTEAAHAANLLTIIPDRYRPVLPAITVVALFFTSLSERVQGGASKPQVREAAAVSDKKNEIEVMNK